MAEQILTRMNNIARMRDITLPGRQVVYPASIPADCEQVAIMFTGWSPTVVAEDCGGGCLRLKWAADFAIAIIRESPAVVDMRGRLPLPEVMDAYRAVGAG